MLVLSVPVAAYAQGMGGTRETAWFDINVGLSGAAQSTLETSRDYTLFLERARGFSDYEWPGGTSFNVAAGWMFTDGLGLGVSLAGASLPGTASFGVTIPHPTVFNRPASATGQSEDGDLSRSERALNIPLMLRLPIESGRIRARVFAGPSRFNLAMEMVEDIRYRQTFLTSNGSNSVSITGFDVLNLEGSSWGYHAGADLSFMFTNTIGLGIEGRFSRGTVTLDTSDILTTAPDEEDITVGGLQFNIGLRFRF